MDGADNRRMFDHERLDAYKHAVAFPLNIAEGNGKRSVADRVRFLEVARGSAFECAACLDVLVVRKTVSAETAAAGKMTLVRVVSTITKLIAWLEGNRERERVRERERPR